MKMINNKRNLVLATIVMILSTLACSVLQVGVVTPTPEDNILPISDGVQATPTSDGDGSEDGYQQNEEQEPEAAPVILSAVAWQGRIASMPEGSQYDDVLLLNPEGTGEYGLAGATPEIEAEIRTLRDGEGPQENVHLWGTFTCGVDDVNGCQL